MKSLPEKERVARIWRFVQDELEDRSGVIASDEEWTIDRIVRNRRGTPDERARVLFARQRSVDLEVGTFPPDRHVFRIRAPRACTWDQAGAGTVEIKTELGAYRRSASEDDGRWVISEEIQLGVNRVRVEQLEKFRELVNAMVRARSEAFVCRDR